MKVIVNDFIERDGVFYTVNNGDTLESIASQFGISSEYIIENNTKNIYKGLVLYFPQTSFESYIVKPFDTLQSIATKKQVDIEVLKHKNNLNNDFVFVGQKLYL